MCPPLWTANVSSQGSVTVAGGTVFVGSDQAVFAFDATGTTGCSGVAPARVCAPLWTAPTAFNSGSTPSVANGVVYVGSDTTLYAFDAHGTTRCSGAPKTCAPLWTASLSGGTTSAPSVVNGVVYVGASDGFLGSGTGRLYAFDAAGTQQCSGPVNARVCNPLWTAAAGEMGQPAVAEGRVFVGSSDGNLYAFDAAGQTSCSGAPKTCHPLMRAAAGATAPAVANDVVYIQNATAAKVVAVDATGNLSCAGAPPLCAPLWSANDADFNEVQPIIADAVVYFGNGSQVFGYALPTSSPPPS
jgi:outer membrane protein assembly factor BamB